MKLGFWNRLAIVAIGLACLSVPPAYVLYGNAELERFRETYYQACMVGAREFLELGDGSRYAQVSDECLDERFAPDRISYGWPQWQEALEATFIASCLIYVLLFAISRIVRWVWRGRQGAS